MEERLGRGGRSWETEQAAADSGQTVPFGDGKWLPQPLPWSGCPDPARAARVG